MAETKTSETCPYTITRTYKISDVNGNSTTAEYKIVVEGEETELKSGQGTADVTVTLNRKTDVSCNGGSDGEITVDITSTNPPYSISWSGAESGSDSNLSDGTYTISNLTAGNYTVEVTDQKNNPQSLLNIIINEPNPLSILDDPEDTRDCEGHIVSFYAEAANGSGNYTYTWQRKKPSESFTDLAAGGNISFPDPGQLRIENVGNADALDKTEYRVIISDGCETVTSDPATLFVNELTGVDPSYSDGSIADITICEGENFSYTVTTSGATPVGYQWKKYSPGNWDNVTNGGVISGAQSEELIFTGATPSESGKYKVTVTFPSSGADCNVTSDSRTRQLTVLGELIAPVISSAQTICNGETPSQLSAAAATGGSGPFTYQWQNSTDGTNFFNISGATSLTYSPPSLSSTTYYRIEAVNTGDPSCGTVVSNVLEITVNPLPTASITGNNGDICSGDDATFNLSGTANATVTYSINSGANQTISLDGSGTATVTISGATADQILELISVENSTTGCSQNISGSSPVTVNPLPTASVTGNNGDICSEEDATFTLSGTANATATYTINSGSNQTVNLDGAGVATITVTGAITDQVLELVSVENSTTGCSQSISGSSTATVNPLPTASITGNNGDICSGEDATFNLTGTANATVTYTINSGSNQTISLNGSGSATVTINGATANQTMDLVSVENNITGCLQSVSGTETVPINPLPVPTITGDFAPCQTATVTYTTESGMSNYDWSLSAGGSIISGGDGTDAITVKWNNSGNQAIEINYETPEGCTASNSTVKTVTVYAKPTLTITNPEAECAPGTVNLTASAITAGSTSGLTFEYFTDVAGTSALPNPDNVNVSGTYYVRGTSANGCYTNIKHVTVTIHPEVSVVTTDPNSVCTPATVNLTNAAITTGSSSGLTFSYWLDANATNPLTNYTTVAASGIYWIKGTTTNGCSDIQPVNVTVNTTPEITTASTKTICSGESTNITLEANVPASFSWTIGEVTGDVTGTSDGFGASINQTLTATGTGGTVEYLVTPISITGNCTGEIYSITLTVQTPPVVIQQPEPVFLVCGKSNTVISSTSLASPTATIQWEYSENGSTGWNLVPEGTGSGVLSGYTFGGTNTSSLELFAPDKDDELFFRAKFSNVCGTVYSNFSHVIVDKKGPFINTDITLSVACAGGYVTITAKITGAGAGNKPENKNKADLQYFNGTSWENVPGSHQESNNSGHIDYSYTVFTGDYPPEPEFRIYVTGKCGTVNTSIKILYLQSVVTTLNTCVGGSNVNFLVDDKISSSSVASGEGWSVSGGGTIDVVTGLFTPTTPGCYTATYVRGGCTDTKPFVVFPSAPTPTVSSGCGAELNIPDISTIPGFTAEFSVVTPSGTASAFGTRATANSLLTNSPGCWTINTRYVLSEDCSYTYYTIPAGTVSPCGETSINALVLPEPPVLNTPTNACNTSFTLPSVPAISGFSVEWKIDGNNWAANPILPNEPGCHTIQARYVLENNCGPAGTTGEDDCVSNLISVVIFPPAPAAPEVTAGCGQFTVTAPPAIDGFDIEYSYDNGSTWVTSNQSPAGDNCSGYEVRTRYVLAADCGITPAGKASPNAACSQSPATLRIVDKTPPVIACNTAGPEIVCVNNGSTYLHSGTSWDVSVTDNCPGVTSFATLTVDTEADNLTTLNGVVFNEGTTTVTWTAYDGCNTVTCSFEVTVNPRPVISPIAATICSGGSFSITPVDGTVPFGTNYSWSAPSVAGIDGAISGTNEISFSSGTLTNTTTNPIDVVFTVTPTANNCTGASFTITITVNPNVICNITGPVEPLCPDTEYTFSAETGMSNYVWSVTGNATIVGNADGETVAIQTAADICDGSFTLNLNYNDANDCGSTCELTVLIGDDTAPVITTQPSPGSADCNYKDPFENASFIAWLTSNGGAAAIDNCSDVTWSNNGNSLDNVWVIDTDTHTKTITVTFTATDECGNETDTEAVSFTIIDDQPPTITCPGSGNPIVLQAITGECEVTSYTENLDPAFSDDCSNPTISYQLVLSDGTIIEDDESVTGYHFPLGETEVTYTATDDVGNKATCTFTVVVEWTEFYETIVDCPEDPEPVFAQNGATEAWVAVPAPTFTDPCVAVESMVHDSPYSSETGNANGNYPIGTTIVIWTITDVSGNTYECEQEVVVLTIPDIKCPDPITIDASSGQCSALFDPLEAELISGGHPLVWTYTITWPNGTSEPTVTFDEETEGVEGPPQIGELEFPLGTTTIYWTATNLSGSDDCSHTIRVVDNTKPVILPLTPLEDCVEPIRQAVYDASTMDITPDRPEYFRFEEESDLLDIEVSEYEDNCDMSGCTAFEVRWRIDFADGSGLPTSGTNDYYEGQPSTKTDLLNDEILFPGDGVTFQPLVHTITYWIVDCNDNISASQTRTFTVNPRPEMTKMN